MKRAIIIVLDSLGIGASADAESYGDNGSNTLGHIADYCAEGMANNELRRGYLNIPNLQRWGLVAAANKSCGKELPTKQQINPINAYGLTHLLSENICNYYNAKRETDCINVRLSNSYGSPVFNENMCWWLVVNDLCKSAFLKNKIDLLKIYTEEHELEVLKLGITTLSKVKFILIEFRLNDMYLNYSSTKIHNFLKQNKFKLVKKFKFPLFAVEDRIYKKI